jgi:hypothetical protein
MPWSFPALHPFFSLPALRFCSRHRALGDGSVLPHTIIHPFGGIRPSGGPVPPDPDSPVRVLSLRAVRSAAFCSALFAPCGGTPPCPSSSAWHGNATAGDALSEKLGNVGMRECGHVGIGPAAAWRLSRALLVPRHEIPRHARGPRSRFRANRSLPGDVPDQAWARAKVRVRFGSMDVRDRLEVLAGRTREVQASHQRTNPLQDGQGGQSCHSVKGRYRTRSHGRCIGELSRLGGLP